MAIGEMQTTAVGNITHDPETRFTPSGLLVCSFTVAVNPKVRDKESGKWTDGEPSFLRVQAWRDLGEHVAESLVRGDRVIVTGSLREERWEKDGEKHSRWTLTADSVGADLTFATVKVSKTTRQHDAPADDAWATASKTRPAQDAAGGTEDRPF
jgi:single-strand DNA-binding protein